MRGFCKTEIGELHLHRQSLTANNVKEDRIGNNVSIGIQLSLNFKTGNNMKRAIVGKNDVFPSNKTNATFKGEEE